MRVVDIEFAVRERIPLHAALSFANSGTEATGDWRPSVTIQHLNLSRRDDILSISAGPVSLDGESLKSGAGSYFLPLNWGNGGGFTVYGGYSDLDAEDVVEGIDIRGEGWFAGMQGSYRVLSTKKHLVDATLGLVYRLTEDQLILTGEGAEPDFETDAREVIFAPLAASLNYSSAALDRWGGRNFLTVQAVANFEGFMGSSDQKEVSSLRVNADASYLIGRIQAARLQSLFGPKPAAEGAGNGRAPWYLLAKVDGQIAGEPLVPAEQKAVGGASTVRGFPERIVQGDDGVSGGVEIRSPLFSNVILPRFVSQEVEERAALEGRALDRLQFVAFAEGGYVSIQDAVVDKDDYSIASVGAGLRLQLGSYAQMRFDWGFPVTGTDELNEEGAEEVDESGRYHFSAQIQF
jgi:hemolysin activation/secretion protein